MSIVKKAQKQAEKIARRKIQYSTQVGSAVVVLEDGEKYSGVVTKVHGDGLFDVDFEDGDDGCYSATDFC